MNDIIAGPNVSLRFNISAVKNFVRYKERNCLKLPNPSSNTASRLCEAIAYKYNKQCDNEEDKLTTVQVYILLSRHAEIEGNTLILYNPVSEILNTVN